MQAAADHEVTLHNRHLYIRECKTFVCWLVFVNQFCCYSPCLKTIFYLLIFYYLLRFELHIKPHDEFDFKDGLDRD